jgi:hypothetical protein
MLMGANHGAVDMMQAPVQLALGISLLPEFRQDAVSDAGLTPPVEPGGKSLPGAILCRQVPPGRSRVVEPEQAIEDAAALLRRAGHVVLSAVGAAAATVPTARRSHLLCSYIAAYPL